MATQKTVPEAIEKDLAARVKERYKKEIEALPDYPFTNPHITVKVTTDGYSGEVEFFWDDGKKSMSVWEYKSSNMKWHMARDWAD